MGVTGKKVKRSGIGGRARTMAGAGPTDLHYGSRGLPAAYRHPGSLSPHEPCPSGPLVTINDTIRQSVVEAREEGRHSGGRVGTVDGIEDIVSFCEGAGRKRCHLRVPAEESDEEVTSCSSGSKAQRYRNRRSPKPSKKDGESAMEMTLSPVRRMFSAPSDSKGYHTCYPSDDAGAEPDFPAGRSHTAPNPELDHDPERETLRRMSATTRVPRHTEFGMTGAEAGRIDGDTTGDAVMGGGGEGGAPGGPPRDGLDREEYGRHPHEDAKEMACGDGAHEDHCHCRHVDFLIGSYPRVGKNAIIQRMDNLDDTTGRILEGQAIFDNTLKSIRSHQEDYQAKLERMLVQQQGMVDKMIKYLENVDDRMKELETRAGVPGPGPYLPRDPAPESLVRRLTTLRTAAEGVARMAGPMESAPCGPPRVDPSLLRHIPLFSASVMLGEKTREKGSGIGTPKRDTCEGTVEIDMSSPPAAGTFDARAAYERRVAEMDLEIRGGSSGESWVHDLRSGIWTMVGPSMEETKSGPREDMEIVGVYSHSPSNGSGGSVRLGGVIASDVEEAVRIEDLRGVKIPHYDANAANLDDFILDWEDFAEEVVGEMRFRSDAGDKWACRTFPHRLAPELKADLRNAIREKRIRTEEQCLDWLEQEERVDTPNQKVMTYGQYLSTWTVGSCG